MFLDLSKVYSNNTSSNRDYDSVTHVSQGVYHFSHATKCTARRLIAASATAQYFGTIVIGTFKPAETMALDTRNDISGNALEVSGNVKSDVCCS